MITKTSKTTLFEIIDVYKKYFEMFLKRADVQNGKAGSYHTNQDPNGDLPFENWMNLGELRTTTGVCVSMSQAITNDEIFKMLLQSRNAKAKLISIDIKEQFFGFCKPSYSQNAWHTAILIEDSGILFILDATCAQFGNQFVGKLIWNLNTWLETFRSPADSHELTDFNGNIIDTIGNNMKTESYEEELALFKYNLKSIISIDDSERELIGDFFLQGIHLLNRKIITGNISQNDYQYMHNINNILKQFTLCKYKNQYAIKKFDNKHDAKKFITEFIDNNCILPGYIITSNSIQDACKLSNFNTEEINIESSSEITYILIKWENLIASSVEHIVENASAIIPFGICNICNPATDIINGGKLLEETVYGIEKKTNTIVINIAGI